MGRGDYGNLLRAVPPIARCATLAVAGLLMALPEAGAAEKWSAASGTAMAITGDVVIDGTSLTFGNGTSVELTPVGVGTPDLFTLEPSDPELMNGNRLCGGQGVAYLGILRDGDALYMKAFDIMPSEPLIADPLAGEGMCATYNFFGPEPVSRTPTGNRADAGRWTASPSPDNSRVSIQAIASDGQSAFSGGCNRRLGPGLSMTLTDYAGGGLARVDDEGEPVIFQIESARHGPARFPVEMHYFAPDQAWVTSQLLPMAFVEAFARGDLLVLANGQGVAVTSFGLAGSARAVATMRTVCGM